MTENFIDIKAAPEEVYKAFVDPKALEIWQAPGGMTAKVHWFELRVGGGYQMSVFYPDTDEASQGKTASKEDRYTSRFVELVPGKKIVEAIRFDTVLPDFQGEMRMEVELEPIAQGTRVTIRFHDLPKGIKEEDNEAGTQSSLQKLAAYLQQKRN